MDFPFLIVMDFFLNLSLDVGVNLSLDVDINLGIVCDCKTTPHLLHIFSLSPFCEDVGLFTTIQSLISCPRAGIIFRYTTWWQILQLIVLSQLSVQGKRIC